MIVFIHIVLVTAATEVQQPHGLCYGVCVYVLMLWWQTRCALVCSFIVIIVARCRSHTQPQPIQMKCTTYAHIINTHTHTPHRAPAYTNSTCTHEHTNNCTAPCEERSACLLFTPTKRGSFTMWPALSFHLFLLGGHRVLCGCVGAL